MVPRGSDKVLLAPNQNSVAVQSVELVGREADQAFERTGPTFQRLDAQHTPNLPHAAPVSQQV